MADLIIVLASIATIAGLLFMAFIGGFAIGTDKLLDNHNRRTSARLRTIEAERQIHDLTRRAFIAMAEQAEEHRTRRPGASG